MGMDIYIYKYKGVKCKTQDEFDDYLNNNFDYNYNYEQNQEEEICYWRKAYWLDKWFSEKPENAMPYGGYLLTKNDIEKFYNHCQELIDGRWDKYNYKISDFKAGRVEINDEIDKVVFRGVAYNGIINEIKETMKQIKVLLKEDFENNCFKYYLCS